MLHRRVVPTELYFYPTMDNRSELERRTKAMTTQKMNVATAIFVGFVLTASVSLFALGGAIQ